MSTSRASAASASAHRAAPARPAHLAGSTVTIIGVNVSFLLAGAVVVENVFSIPGSGSLLVDSVFSRDYSVVQGITLVYAMIVDRDQPRDRPDVSLARSACGARMTANAGRSRFLGLDAPFGRIARIGRLRGHTKILIGGTIVGVIVLVALLAPLIAPSGPNAQDLRTRSARRASRTRSAPTSSAVTSSRGRSTRRGSTFRSPSSPRSSASSSAYSSACSAATSAASSTRSSGGSSTSSSRSRRSSPSSP